jgi:hypothetical protein
LTRGITLPWPVDSLPLSREAVAQTPDGRTGSCGWVEIVEGVAQALRALLDLAAPTASYSRYSERSPGSYGRLYATPSRRSERPRRGPPRARSRQRGSDRVDELRRPREVDVGDAAHAERVRFGLVVLDRRGRAGERELEIREGVYRLSPPARLQGRRNLVQDDVGGEVLVVAACSQEPQIDGLRPSPSV